MAIQQLWTYEEVETLAEMYTSRDYSIADVAAHLGRTTGQIRDKAFREGLVRPGRSKRQPPAPGVQAVPRPKQTRSIVPPALDEVRRERKPIDERVWQAIEPMQITARSSGEDKAEAIRRHAARRAFIHALEYGA